MKKSKIFLATGALALAISAVFATKANKKFTQVQTGVANSGDFSVVLGSTLNLFTTEGTAANNVYAEIQLVTGSANHHSALISGDLVTKTSGVPIWLK